MSNIKAIIFDADDTLLDHKECEKQALIHIFYSIGVEYKEEYQNIFRQIEKALWESVSHNNCPVPESEIFIYRFKCLFEKLKIMYDDYLSANELFKKGLSLSNATFNNAEEAIESLFNKGYKLCVATNGLVELQKPRVKNSKIGKFISHVMVSEEVGSHKPNPLIFNALLKRLCMGAESVLMIGDSLKNDIQGAKSVGIKSIWYNPKRIKNETGILPDYEINDLMQIEHIVDAL